MNITMSRDNGKISERTLQILIRMNNATHVKHKMKQKKTQ